ncbi:Plastocyanin [Rhodococcus tukisamuensis]|uniref:Plastocyanin n=1 Tax=Rhodococcus tukisamuensis TaxID=168276 RepID=A0A1G7EA19_9NOCA|nr:Plastocyanin [Rhodococcus tukisamuensis]
MASGLLLTSVLTGCATTESPEVSLTAGGSATVTISNMRFNPSILRIRAGDTVTWVFADQGTEHGVVSNANAQEYFESGVQSSGVYSHKFIRVGMSRYFCSEHASMGGTIIVR